MQETRKSRFIGIIILTVLLLFMATSTVTATSTDDDYFFNVSTMSKSTISTETKLGEFTLVPPSDGTSITVDGSSKKSLSTGESYTMRLKLGGAGAINSRAIRFSTIDAGTFCIDCCSSSGSTARQAVLIDSNGEVISTNEIGTGMSYTKIAVPQAGDYIFYGIDGGINIYYMKVTYEQAPPPGEYENVNGVVMTPMDIIYTAPKASSQGAGTKAEPMSIGSAILNITPGGTIYCDGSYLFDKGLTIALDNNGEEGKSKNIVCSDGTVFDFSAEEYTSNTASNQRGLQINGNYWHIKNLEVYKAADNGYFIAGKHNTLELCVANANRDTGIQVSRRSSTVTDFNDWPSDNLILNCTSFDSFDPATGENADGFAAKLTCGDNNVFDGCIAYNNCDDGWDCFTKSATGPIGSLVMRNCVAFRSGQTTDGTFTENCDGNGFKMGGSKIAVEHSLFNCIAFENANHGFTDNSNPGPIHLTNCTSFNNAKKGGTKKSNFDFARDSVLSFNYLTNCLAYTDTKIASDKFIGEVNNSVLYNNAGAYYYLENFPNTNWNNKEGLKLPDVSFDAVTDNTFVSIQSPELGADVHTLWRNEDGSVNLGNFLKVADGTVYKERNIGADLSGTPIVPPSPAPTTTPDPSESPSPVVTPEPSNYELLAGLNDDENGIDIEFKNNTATQVEPSILIAVYKDNQIVNLYENSITVDENKNSTFSQMLSAKDYDSIKVFAWDDTTNILPFTTPVEIK